MSFVTKCIGLAKKAKHRFEDQIKARTPVYLSTVRRIERVATGERMVAMTFDDGPCRLPANPDRFGGKPLTLVLAETLEKYHAKGTFDVIGDTAGNYPDTAGKESSAAWGGIAFDHYPDFQKDSEGGVAHCPELIDRLLAGGHQLTSHTWQHILWGRKNIVYGKRHHLNSLEEVVEDLQIMDRTLKEKWNYSVTMSRPPHYVDQIPGGFTSYDAYTLMNYQYLAAGFDGAGWLPLASYEAEVEATWKPMAQLLEKDPDALCGQIIFQKDGFNMARRSPVADGLEKQLELLTRYGYKVVTVEELLAHSAFADTLPTPAQNARACMEAGWCVAFQDNTLRLETVLTKEALIQMAYGKEGAARRIELIRQGQKNASHPYSGALAIAAERIGLAGDRSPATQADLRRVLTDRCPHAPEVLPEGPITHGEFFTLLQELL
ncbi:MAG: polysaccharide deacetylase family protein [Clostridia bacterium]|nr:polysaccharide deacetylase family protein [Clostridia bacterium]